MTPDNNGVGLSLRPLSEPREDEDKHSRLKEALAKVKEVGERTLVKLKESRVKAEQKAIDKQREVVSKIKREEHIIPQAEIPKKTERRLNGYFNERIDLERRKLNKEIATNKLFNREKLEYERQITNKLQNQESILRQQVKQDRTIERMDRLDLSERRRKNKGVKF